MDSPRASEVWSAEGKGLNYMEIGKKVFLVCKAPHVKVQTVIKSRNILHIFMWKLCKHICTNQQFFNSPQEKIILPTFITLYILPPSPKGLHGFFTYFSAFLISLILLQTKLIRSSLRPMYNNRCNVTAVKLLTTLLKMCTRAKWNKLLT